MTTSIVTAGLKRIKEIDAEDEPLFLAILKLQRKRAKLDRERQAIRRRIACRKVRGCRGFLNHMGCHNV